MNDLHFNTAKDAGLELAQLRSKSGLSLDDISVSTKISLRVLKALEAGDVHSLPPRSFTRGFIRSYCAYLKVQSEPFLKAFDEPATAKIEAREPLSSANDSIIAVENKTATKNLSDKSTSPAYARVDLDSMGHPSKTKIAFFTVIILTLIGLIFAVQQVINRYASERVSEESVLETTFTTERSEENSSSEISPAADGFRPLDNEVPFQPQGTTAASVNAKPAEPKPVEQKPTDQKPLTTPTAVATLPAVTTTAPATVTPTTTTPAAPPTTSPTVTSVKNTNAASEATAPGATSTSPQVVLIEALDKVEITVITDGGKKEKITLQPEAVHTIRAQKEVSLEISDGGLVNITHNGTDRGNAGTLGQSAKVKYP